jgi:hypothetical protein
VRTKASGGVEVRVQLAPESVDFSTAYPVAYRVDGVWGSTTMLSMSADWCAREPFQVSPWSMDEKIQPPPVPA